MLSDSFGFKPNPQRSVLDPVGLPPPSGAPFGINLGVPGKTILENSQLALGGPGAPLKGCGWDRPLGSGSLGPEAGRAGPKKGAQFPVVSWI